ncbi:hypothetical protein PoB_001192100 [Plakobranchus ocellatus]|uniref:Uncharacterized protein n=1 Tax=Plakobranchus ocellatus TaxID=259542 RepID=A0AAV3YDM8_9GAST|nr:hypothetical protein PoB_001192100 [Plakobranchus ocellatus]
MINNSDKSNRYKTNRSKQRNMITANFNTVWVALLESRDTLIETRCQLKTLRWHGGHPAKPSLQLSPTYSRVEIKVPVVFKSGRLQARDPLTSRLAHQCHRSTSGCARLVIALFKEERGERARVVGRCRIDDADCHLDKDALK